MGLDPVVDDYIEGVQCAQCEAALFNGVTPKYVEANIQGVTTCGGNPVFQNGAYILTQIVPACEWRYIDGFWQIRYQLVGGQSIFNIVNFVSDYFSDIGAANCRDSFTNTLGACGPPFQGGTGGTADIFWGPGIEP